jgi:hypothetical protein
MRLILGAGLLVCAGLAHGLNLWQYTWRGLPMHLKSWATLLRLWVWFTWPAWPLALWSLWVWRRSWWTLQPSRHIALPLIMMLPAAMATLFTWQEERALLLTLPCLAALSAFALPTLRRSVSALIDWFTLLFFTGSALVIWIVWWAGLTGWPAQPAANLARLLPGLALPFSFGVFALALLASLTWVALVAWRVGRHRSALWKSLVLPASGATLCWLLLMTLWLPMIDFARSYAPTVRNVTAVMGHPSCVHTQGLSLAQLAALQHHGALRIEPLDPLACDWLIVGQRHNEAFQTSDAAASWRWVQTVRRPTDQYENLIVYQRQQGARP